MSQLSPDFEELRISVERLRTLLEGLVVRGLRACGPDELGQLKAFVDEFERAGAAHIASALATLHEQAERGERHAASTLLTAQISVRMLDRLLTLRVAKGAYEMAIQAAQGDENTAAENEEGGEEE